MGQEKNIRTMEGFCDKVKASAGKTFNVERGGISHVAFVTKHCAKHYLAKKISRSLVAEPSAKVCNFFAAT